MNSSRTGSTGVTRRNTASLPGRRSLCRGARRKSALAIGSRSSCCPSSPRKGARRNSIVAPKSDWLSSGVGTDATRRNTWRNSLGQRPTRTAIPMSTALDTATPATITMARRRPESLDRGISAAAAKMIANGAFAGSVMKTPVAASATIGASRQTSGRGMMTWARTSSRSAVPAIVAPNTVTQL
jgi:hypothetical protein